MLKIVPLVPNLPLPGVATVRTRTNVPPGYGVQEHCLPFTAASALGFLIPSPIDFGLCAPERMPSGCHAFRSPVAPDGRADDRIFYVRDNPACRFQGNAYHLNSTDTGASDAYITREPGISFFDRADQQDLFKLHLPYICRTPEGVDTLFMPLLNRQAQGLTVQSGLVETDWYASPVNLILRKPESEVHFRAGEPIAHAILIPREFRRPAVEVLPDHARLSRDTRNAMAEWDRQHSENRSTYKLLTRSRHGRIDGA